jgi:hypothetical protein
MSLSYIYIYKIVCIARTHTHTHTHTHNVLSSSVAQQLTLSPGLFNNLSPDIGIILLMTWGEGGVAKWTMGIRNFTM